MKRIAIIGCAGAGKSTVARELGRRLGIEVIHLDRLFWKPGWVETPRPLWREQVAELVERPTWIIDGNYGSTMDIKLPAADTIVFLDLAPGLCLWRVLKRTLSGQSRPDLSDGCPERLWSPGFAEFLMWIVRFRRRTRPRILEQLRFYGDGKRVVLLRTAGDIRRFVEQARPS